MNEIILKIICRVAIFFIMMLPGIMLKKAKMISDDFGKGLSNLVLYIGQPALVFMAYVKPYENEKEILINAVYVLVFSVIAHFIFAAVALAVFKKAPDCKGRMLKFATIFANAAFLGLPLVEAVLEKDYPGSTMYASIYNITYNTFLWTLGVKICTKDRDINNDGVDDYKEVISRNTENDDKIVKNNSGGILKAIIHPITIAAALGILYFVLPMENVTVSESFKPALEVATESINMLKNLVAPLSMVVIGIRLADIKLDGLFKDKLMYLFLLLRHIALPLIVLGLIKLVSLCGIYVHPAVEMVTVILAGTPAAAASTMFAEKFNCDSAYVSKLVIISTILSIGTIPLIMLLV